MKRIVAGAILMLCLFLPATMNAQQSIEQICVDKCQDAGCTGDDCAEKYDTCRNNCKANYDKCTSQGDSAETCLCVAGGGIKLNTNFPFIGRCIAKTSDGSAIGNIAQVFTTIFMTLIITIGFGMLIRAGVQFAMNKPAEGKKTIMNIVIGFAALGSLGIILRLINPNFFR